MRLFLLVASALVGAAAAASSSASVSASARASASVSAIKNKATPACAAEKLKPFQVAPADYTRTLQDLIDEASRSGCVSNNWAPFLIVS